VSTALRSAVSAWRKIEIVLADVFYSQTILELGIHYQMNVIPWKQTKVSHNPNASGYSIQLRPMLKENI
jgi:hypothetical protein